MPQVYHQSIFLQLIYASEKVLSNLQTGQMRKASILIVGSMIVIVFLRKPQLSVFSPSTSVLDTSFVGATPNRTDDSKQLNFAPVFASSVRLQCVRCLAYFSPLHCAPRRLFPRHVAALNFPDGQ